MAIAENNRVLLISWDMPPSPTASAVIVGNLAKQFRTEEMALAGEEPPSNVSLKWDPHWPELHYVVSRWNKRGRNTRRRLMLPLTIARCVRLAKRFDCGKIVVVFPKGDFLLVGYITAKLTGKPFYAYFHNTYVENRTGIRRIFAEWLQGRVFREAERIFVMSEGMLEFYSEKYPGVAFEPLVHSFNESIPRFTLPPPPTTPLRFAISGSIHESCLDATLRFCDAMEDVGDSELTLLSGTPRAYLAGVGVLRNGVRHMTVSRDRLIGCLQAADILVLPHGLTGGFSDIEYRTIFPTKLIEYLISGRPILAHTPEGCFLTRFLREHRCALVVDKPDRKELVSAVERLRTDAALRNDLVRNALRTAEMFHAPKVAATFRQSIGVAQAEIAVAAER